MPRDRYDSRIRALIGDYLAATRTKAVWCAFRPFTFPEGPLVRVQFAIIGLAEGEMPHPDRATARRRG